MTHAHQTQPLPRSLTLARADAHPATSTSPRPAQLVLPAASVLAVLVGMALLLALAHGGVRVCWEAADCGALERPISRHGWLFDLGAEMNVPSWFSSSQLLLAAGLLAVIAFSARLSAPGTALPWAALALIFVYLSLDEISDLHGLWRQFTLPDSYRLPGTTDPNYAWVVPGIVLVVVLAFTFRRFVFDLPPQTRSLVLLAGSLYVGGAIGAELLGGLIVNATWNNGAFLIVSALEEICEMIGISIFIYALLTYLGGSRLQVRIGPAESLRRHGETA